MQVEIDGWFDGADEEVVARALDAPRRQPTLLQWSAWPVSQRCPFYVPRPRISERINPKEVVENGPVDRELVTTSKSFSVERGTCDGRALTALVVLADGNDGEVLQPKISHAFI